MKPSSFEYHAPRTIEDAVALLSRFAPEEGRVLAGGQTLVPAMAMRLARPGHLIDINRVAGLDTMRVEGDALTIGACVRHAALGSGAAPGPLGRLLGLVQHHIAHPPIRARGTFCGSLANADAASEWCLLAVALGARITARCTSGIRIIAADDFFLGYMTTALEPDEIITSVALPLLPEGTRVGFYEFARRAGDFAQVMALATYTLKGGTIEAPRVALGSLESRARRIQAAEAMLQGAAPTEAAFEAAARAGAADVHLPDDDPYLRGLAETAILRALAGAG
jgi:aerobic carbon-monoxide dehydrogenase medium subunit